MKTRFNPFVPHVTELQDVSNSIPFLKFIDELLTSERSRPRPERKAMAVDEFMRRNGGE